MFKFKVKVPLAVDIIAQLRIGLVDSVFVKKIQDEVIDQTIKPLIASGVSPVEGYEKRRFPKYKDPKTYPAKKKSRSPVSLYLTGVMLSWYKAYKISGNIIRLGIPSSAPQDVKDRALGNNLGTTTKSGAEGIPARRFIPQAGETFRISVLRRLKKVYAERIARLISTKK